MSLTAVSGALWRERELLGLLAHELAHERPSPAAGRARRPTSATCGVGTVLAELGRCELDRALEVDAVTEQLGLPGDTGLRELAGRVPAPWDGILVQHRTALLALSDGSAGLARSVPPSLLDFLR